MDQNYVSIETSFVWLPRRDYANLSFAAPVGMFHKLVFPKHSLPVKVNFGQERSPEPVNEFETPGMLSLLSNVSEMRSLGGLIHAAVGSGAGVGSRRTKRSGVAAYAAARTLAR